MAHHDVVVIGASSGGLGPLQTLLSGLPAELAAAVLVVVHVPPDLPSQLPAILNRAGALPVAHAVDGEPIRRGRVYVAPPGLQTYVHLGRIGVRPGTFEDLYRPSIDVLFRSAAHHYGSRVIGIILSGSLHDGAAGLRGIKHAGGVAIVQNPDEALFPSMPASACEAADPDYRVGAADLSALVERLVREPAAALASTPQTVER